MTRFLPLSGAAAAAALLAAGCTQSGQTERSAATGAALGAAVGAIASDETAEGAAIGAAVGGTAGAATGCWEALDCDVPGVNDPYDPTLPDRSAQYSDRNDRYPDDPYRQ